MFEPQKFFIGLMDFFSILLPGALLTYIVRDDLGPLLVGPGFATLSGTEGWAVFLLTSWLLGHMTFLIGAGLLDDHLYDPIRRATLQAETGRLAGGGVASSALTRWWAARLFKGDVDELVERAVAIKDHHLSPVGAQRAINAFQWSKARLLLGHPEASVAVERFEAASKFFRSLVVVFAFAIPWDVLRGTGALAGLALPMLVLSLWRYVDQRVKSTSQAYRYVIALEAATPDGYREGRDPPGWATHAGGVVYRMSRGTPEYLLVTARRAPDEWVLPKGHIEPGEDSARTAVREVREEAGIVASVREELEEVTLSTRDGEVRVAFFVMEETGRAKRSDMDRTRSSVWLHFDAAMQRATHAESRMLLEAARRRVEARR